MADSVTRLAQVWPDSSPAVDYNDDPAGVTAMFRLLLDDKGLARLKQCLGNVGTGISQPDAPYFHVFRGDQADLDRLLFWLEAGR